MAWVHDGLSKLLCCCLGPCPGSPQPGVEPWTFNVVEEHSTAPAWTRRSTGQSFVASVHLMQFKPWMHYGGALAFRTEGQEFDSRLKRSRIRSRQLPKSKNFRYFSHTFAWLPHCHKTRQLTFSPTDRIAPAWLQVTGSTSLLKYYLLTSRR